MEKLLVFSALVFALSLPFGYWRADSRKFSLGWVLAIHIPVPIIIFMRWAFGFGLIVLPISVLFFLLGQFAGAKVRALVHASGAQPSSCMVMDLAELLSARVTG